ncbi:MAG: hypothetical protein P8I91_01495 [Phycisphaerales bacterium]|nr:hypothetical protein [Phycisphaerales bacterium]
MITLQVGMVVVTFGMGMLDAGSVSPVGLASKLNAHPSVAAPDEQTAWAVLAPALRSLSVPPDTATLLRQESVWPGMPEWEEVSAWAASSPDLRAAITEAAQRPIFGLKYGRDAVASEDAASQFIVDLGAADARLVLPTYPYLNAIGSMTVWTAAEAYRLVEAGEHEAALTLLLDELVVLRRIADREFMAEKEAAIRLLNSGLGVFRDVMFRSLDHLSASFLAKLALHEIPSLRPGRESLFMPEHDQRLCEALLANAFDESLGGPLEEEFPAVFTEVQVQATDRPLQRFGARRRWESIYEAQDSLDACLERLELIFDDWWRRWRSIDSDMMGRMILNQQSQFELMNIARFAAIDAVIHDMTNLFEARERLVMEANATATATSLAAYLVQRGQYPQELRLAFGITMDKMHAIDPHASISEDYRPWFCYRRLKESIDIDVGTVRVEVPAGTGLLYSAGLDGLDGYGILHVDERGRGDLIIWPPPRVMIRMAEAGESLPTPKKDAPAR